MIAWAFLPSGGTRGGVGAAPTAGTNSNHPPFSSAQARATKRPRRLTCTRASAAAPGDEASGSDAPPPSLPDTLPLAGADTDWRAFRARLVAATSAGASGEGAAAAAGTPDAEDDPWAHKLPRPEQGCLLLAHPLMFSSAQTYFHQAVILLFQHDERGSAGLILNRCDGGQGGVRGGWRSEVL